MSRTIAVLFASAALAAAQPIGAGVKVGLPFSDAFRLAGAGFDTERPTYTVGPFVELRLPASLAIEVGALYEGLRVSYRSTVPGLAVDVSTTVSSWQFPLLLKYRIGEGMARPFVGAGVAAYRVGGFDTETLAQLPRDLRATLSRAGDSFVNGGGLITGGVELKAGPLRLAPEVRFTRWAIRRDFGTDEVTLRLSESRTHLFLSVSF